MEVGSRLDGNGAEPPILAYSQSSLMPQLQYRQERYHDHEPRAGSLQYCLERRSSGRLEKLLDLGNHFGNGDGRKRKLFGLRKTFLAQHSPEHRGQRGSVRAHDLWRPEVCHSLDV